MAKLKHIKVSCFVSWRGLTNRTCRCKGSRRVDFLGMPVLWFQLELWMAIQHIRKALSLLKKHKLLCDPAAIYLLFFISPRWEQSSPPFLLGQIKHQPFKTYLWPTGNQTQGLSSNNSWPIEAFFVEGREERKRIHARVCSAEFWCFILHHSLCITGDGLQAFGLDKCYSVMYTKWVQVSW